jgi:outer membrane protein TolC
MRFVLSVVLLLFLITPGYSVSVLTYEDVMSATLKNAFDLKLAQKDIEISQAEKKAHSAALFPSLSLLAYSDYTSDLLADEQEVVVVGDQVFGDESKFQSALTLQLNYTIFDSGLWRAKDNYWQKDILAKKCFYALTKKQIKQKALDLYTQALLAYEEITCQKKQVLYSKNLEQFYKRLYRQGQISKLKWTQAEIDYKNSVLKLSNSEQDSKAILQQLSFYTRKKYQSEDFIAQGFTSISLDCTEILGVNIPTFNVRTSAAYQQIEATIAQKESELNILQKENKPKISLDAQYLYYGADYENLSEAISQIQPKTWVARVSFRYPLFQGFLEAPRVAKAYLELAKLQTQKEKLVWEKKSFYSFYRAKIKQNKAELEYNLKLYQEARKKAEMVKRLRAQKLVDQAALIEQKIELEQALLNQKKKVIQSQSELLSYYYFMEEERI